MYVSYNIMTNVVIPLGTNLLRLTIEAIGSVVEKVLGPVLQRLSVCQIYCTVYCTSVHYSVYHCKFTVLYFTHWTSFYSVTTIHYRRTSLQVLFRLLEGLLNDLLKRGGVGLSLGDIVKFVADRVGKFIGKRT